jgi:hypothetical protein
MRDPPDCTHTHACRRGNGDLATWTESHAFNGTACFALCRPSLALETKARHTLIHSRPSQCRLPSPAHDSVGAVAHFYFGAHNEGGCFWSQWCAYLSGHGDNVRLRKMIKEDGPKRAEGFHFSVLEIADTHTKAQEVLEREAHWERVLLSREHGHNGNWARRFPWDAR